MSKMPKKKITKSQEQAIISMQNDSSHIVANNSLRFVKFGSRLKNGVVKDEKETTHIAKLFWESLSLLTPDDIVDPEKVITKYINIGDLVSRIGTEGNHKYVVDAARALRSWEIMLIDQHGNKTYTGFFASVEHVVKSGTLEIEISNSWAKYALEIIRHGNFNFKKSYLLKLQHVAAIRLYTFFKSWANHGIYDTDLERFKKDFGYDSGGYSRFAHLKTYVLEPAMDEINKKTDLTIRYEAKGDNLNGIRPRVKGLRFFIDFKEMIKEEQTEEETFLDISKSLKSPKGFPPLIKRQLREAIALGHNIETLVQDENGVYQSEKSLQAQKAAEKTKNAPQPKAPKTPQNAPQPKKIETLIQDENGVYEANTSLPAPTFADIRKLVTADVLNDDEIEELISDFGYISTWEKVAGLKRANAENRIKVPLAYIFKSQHLGIGLWKQEQQKQEQARAKREAEKIQALNQEYQKRKEAYFEKTFDEATEGAQQQAMQAIENIIEQTPELKSYYLKDGKISITGKRKAGQLLLDSLYTDAQRAEKGLLDTFYRQQGFKNTVLTRDNMQIGFDEKDQVVKGKAIQNILF